MQKRKLTQEEKVVELLKKGWFTNYGMQQILKSSSADRAFRRARKKGVAGYKVVCRVKENAPVRCFEYRIVKDDKQVC